MTEQPPPGHDSADRPATRPDEESARSALHEVRAEVAKAVVGQDQAVSGLIVALLARGHVLLEGVPGVAKTLLVRTLATALSVDTKRVQFTPDLMPGDVTGSMIYDSGRGEFAFRPGPVFTNLLLADEINRTPPKTQSALLEAMQEHQVTVEGQTHRLPQPFHVLATANPVEYEGTYPLPEAQLDRFLARVSFGYPSPEEEWDVLRRRVARQTEDQRLEPVTDAAGLAAMQDAVERVPVEDDISRYCVELASATRRHRAVLVGASPRGSLALMLTSRAYAVVHGRDYVTPEDVKAVAHAVLDHRISIKPELWMSDTGGATVVTAALGQVPVPGARTGASTVDEQEEEHVRSSASA